MIDPWIAGSVAVLAGLVGWFGRAILERVRVPNVKVNVACLLTVEEMHRLAFRHKNESEIVAHQVELEDFGWTVARRMMALSYPSEVWIDDRRIDLVRGGAQVTEEYSASKDQGGNGASERSAS